MRSAIRFEQLSVGLEQGSGLKRLPEKRQVTKEREAGPAEPGKMGMVAEGAAALNMSTVVDMQGQVTTSPIFQEKQEI